MGIGDWGLGQSPIPKINLIFEFFIYLLIILNYFWIYIQKELCNIYF